MQGRGSFLPGPQYAHTQIHGCTHVHMDTHSLLHSESLPSLVGQLGAGRWYNLELLSCHCDEGSRGLLCVSSHPSVPRLLGVQGWIGLNCGVEGPQMNCS